MGLCRGLEVHKFICQQPTLLSLVCRTLGVNLAFVNLIYLKVYLLLCHIESNLVSFFFKKRKECHDSLPFEY